MNCDFLVVGSGIAGLSFALRAAELGSVTIITKKNEVDSATNLAQGGIAAVLSEDDTFESHIKDTLKAGADLCDLDVVKLVVENGPDRVRDLIDIGVNFVAEQNDNKHLDLGKEGGHSKRRVAHAFDLTGREIERALLEKAKSNSNITIKKNCNCIDLIMQRASDSATEDRCFGAYILDGEDIEAYTAKTTVLCTGGTGKVYLYTSNPDIASGDGIAMAFRAGAEVANMEFVQFHPTCLFHPAAKNFLISEAVRGEGAILKNKKGERFMARFEPDRMELATRDKVARAIDQELKETGEDCVYLDISHKDADFIRERFPAIHGKCLELGIDITKKPIPVVPAAHYLCGGIITDDKAKTNIKGLYAIGETACTGLHGGNRLASNSLLEAVVYAERAYSDIADNWGKIQTLSLDKVDEWESEEAVDLDEEILINHNWDVLRRTMWNYVGIVRNDRRLGLASKRISNIVEEIEDHYMDFHVSPSLIELRNIAIISNLIVDAAIERKESRGLHYTLDYLETDNEHSKHWNVFKRSIKKSKTPWKSEKVREVPV